MSANRIRSLLALAFIAFALPAAAQNGTITGRVTDQGGQPRPGAIVRAIAGVRTVGTAIADDGGAYRISNLPPGTYSVQARFVGFSPRSVNNVIVGAGASATADISLTTNVTQLDETTVTASRREEKVLDAPASVSIITEEKINARPAINVADHVAASPGIDVARGGIVRSNIVSRGFNNIFSGALMTLTDNRFAFVPSLRVNIPYLSTTTMEDIERIELVLGPGAALYGPNTASGVMALITKSPFGSQGTTVTIDGGNQSVLRGGIRSAWTPTPKLGFKLAYEGFRGEEWPFLPQDTIGEQKPRDRDVNRHGGEVRLDFRPTGSSEIIANYGRSQAGSAVEPTGLGPAQIKDWVYQTYQLRGRYNQLFAQVFMNTSDAGGTFLLQKVRPATNCPDVADDACIIDQSRQFAAQVQHGLNFGLRQRFLYGLDYIHTTPQTEGTINGRNDDDDEITEVGGYLHSVTSLSSMFELTTAARVDKHSRLENAVFSPRVALVFKPDDDQAFRLTYNRAFSTPSTNNLFLDLVATRTSLLNIRALGTPETGFQFRRDCATGIGSLCMKVFPAFGGTGSFVAANPYANSFAAARTGVIASLTASFTAQFIAAGLPPAVAAGQAAVVANATANFLGSRQPTAEQVGTTLVIPGVPGAPAFPVSASQLLDIDRPKPTIHNAIEAGYKGLIGKRLQLSLDVWHDRRENFVGPLQLESPLVFLNGNTLGAYLGAQLAGFFPTIGLPAAAAGPVAAALAGSLPGSNPTAACSLTAPAGCPIGVVNFDTPNAGNDVIVAYRSYDKDLSLWGSDLGLEILLDGGFSVQGTYSYVSKKLFSKADLGTREDVSLNAPANKHSVAINYRNEANGLSAEVRERHVDGFNTLAFVGGAIEPYTLIDAGVSFRPSFLNGALIALNGTNLLNKRHREFTQGGFIGRLIMTRLQMTF
ncbi:MAG: TonB-dependent receptor [Gemmatimonadaceae bacterium]|nr:TonB-dependent receptor [Gemmatimonadaceae bacterium]